MVERDVYCTDILVQVAAVNAALNSFNKVLLAEHIKTCVARDIREGKEETVDELARHFGEIKISVTKQFCLTVLHLQQAFIHMASFCA